MAGMSRREEGPASIPAATDPAAQDREGVLAQTAGEMHQRLEKRPGGQPEDGAYHRSAFRAKRETLRDAGRDEADDEERCSEAYR